MKKIKKVYIILHGEQGEGGDVYGVLSDRKKAVKCAMEIKPCFPGGWKKEKNIDMWINGCDFVSVEKWRIK